jgi:hypothetical protein
MLMEAYCTHRPGAHARIMGFEGKLALYFI